jgi:hypothetical protein
VRKAIGALLLLAVAAHFYPAQADTARDGTVNPGNAAHLGAVDAPLTVANGDAGLAAGDSTAETPGQTPAPGCCPGPCEHGGGILEFFGPIAIINQHPPTQLFLAPVPEAATVLGPGESFARLKLDWANNIIRELDDGVIWDFDFEVLRVELDYHRHLAGGELSARLPYYSRTHGILDAIISDWHNTFGQRNGHRDDFPDYLYRYTIVTRDGVVYNEEGDTHGVGDLALGYKFPLWERDDGREAAAVRAGVKLPLGDSARALGSGSLDWQLGALYQRQLGERFRGYANVDWVIVGEPDWERIAHQDMLVTLVAVEYAWRPETTLVAQYRRQGNPLRVGNEEADKGSQELALGFNHRLGGNLVWSGGFNEDINPDTASDFVVMSHLRWEF